MNKDPYKMRSWELRRWRRLGVITPAYVLWYRVAGAVMAVNKWLEKPRISLFEWSWWVAWLFALLLTQAEMWQRTEAFTALVVYWVIHKAIGIAVTFHERSLEDAQAAALSDVRRKTEGQKNVLAAISKPGEYEAAVTEFEQVKAKVQEHFSKAGRGAK